MAEKEQNNIQQEYNNATTGLNMDQVPGQIRKGSLTYALNSVVENFDANGINYQNEPGNELCITFPDGFVSIHNHYIQEVNKHFFFLTNPNTGDSQIGYMENNDCQYRVLLDDPCLNFNINYPIHKVVHKITNCSVELYWTDGLNPRRMLDINNIPRKIKFGSPVCDPEYTDELDCNQLSLQPIFSIPNIDVTDIYSTGELVAGTYQFAIQYSDALGNPFTSYYSVTNPVPIADPTISTLNFDYKVGKAIEVSITNLDLTGQFQHFNVAVIKTINAITSVELVGTYYIEKGDKKIIYTGQSETDIRLSIKDIFEKYPYYELAGDLTTAQDILIWNNLVSVDRINYQHIANKIRIWWATWRIPATESYADEINSTNLRGYLRDEVYSFEIVFLLGGGKETDGFHIPGRAKNFNESNFPDIPDSDSDFIGEPTYYNGTTGYSPYWKIYNTASILGTYPTYTTDPLYKGPYQYGEFAYWESTEDYPCNANIWGELAGKKIRHHKFPDVAISPIFESKTFIDKDSMVMGNDAVFPIGIKIDNDQIYSLIQASNLTAQQKADIVGFKIVRGDRSNNKSIVAKGIIRNVNTYEREGNTYYFPNYPYNDLREDPFINSANNAYTDICEVFDVNITQLFLDPHSNKRIATVQYRDCNTNKSVTKTYTALTTTPDRICSVEKPSIIFGEGTVSYVNYDIWYVKSKGMGGWKVEYEDITIGTTTEYIDGWFGGSGRDEILHVVPGTKPVCIEWCNRKDYIKFIGEVRVDNPCDVPEPLQPISDRQRMVFNSPETSFGQPTLGNILKLESVIFGKGKAHFTEVKKNAKYRLISKEAQMEALNSAAGLGGMTEDFNVEAMFAAYQAYLTVYLNSITRKNYAYSFNSIASYDYMKTVPNGMGIKQRNIDIIKYLIPTVTNVGDDHDINNYYRESSVFIKTVENDPLPFANRSVNMLNGILSIVDDESRFTISDKGNCGAPGKEEDISVVSYYAALKKDFINQWGQIYSYNTIDTGYQCIFSNPPSQSVVFGGDTFISRFAFKTKLPFFIDNRVGAPDDSDIFYDEIGNVGYPKYWHSSRSILEDYSIPPGESDDSPGIMKNIISYKAHNFDCPNDTSIAEPVDSQYTTTTTSTTLSSAFDLWAKLHGSSTDTGLSTSIRTYYDGYFYLFAYGVPNFYCESSYNTDLRQAYNNREGDYWPHVTKSIPDDWVQESFVSIANDNTYYYNTTYSKQNKENYFTHLPFDWEEKLCFTHFPFRAIYSDMQSEDADNRVNNWRIYRSGSYFDFPQNFGRLTSLDGIQNRAILARFENKTLLYNNLLTIDTSNPQSAYLGNPRLFSGAPPIDFADTDLGHMGSQNKMLLKIPEGQVSIDAKRGSVFLINGTQAVEISGFGSGLHRFFTEHLPFEILKYFPPHEETIDGEKVIIEGVNTDNHYNGVGIHGVYDSKYNRVLITKLDYIPIDDRVKYDPDSRTFYVEEIIDTEDSSTYPSFISETPTASPAPAYVPQTGVFCCNPVINTGEKKTGIDGGLIGERSISDDYEYICVQGGAPGVAIWKKTVLYRT